MTDELEGKTNAEYVSLIRGASAAYYNWRNQGSPYRLAQPLKDLQRNLRAHGLTVYDYPDDSHLLASTPEDHTPFAKTGWPVASAFGVAHAIDIMPRNSTAAARAENTAIAKRLIADKDAGYAYASWIKYINWTDENGKIWHTSWQPNKSTVSSTDAGHVHVSGRSDMDTFGGAVNYDPLSTGNGDDDMITWQIVKHNDGRLLKCNGDICKVISPANLGHLKTLAGEGVYRLLNADNPRTGYNPDAFGDIVVEAERGNAPQNVTVTMSPEDITNLAHTIVTSLDTSLSAEDRAVMVSAVEEVISNTRFTPVVTHTA